MDKRFFLKVLITILLFSFVLLKLDISNVYEVLINSNIILIFTSFFFVPLLYSIRVLKWDALLRSAGIRYSFSKLMRVLLIGVFYGMITPGKAGEVMRAYYLNSDKAKTIPTILWDKTIDVLVLFIFSLFSTVFLFYNKNLYSVLFLLSLLFIITIAIFLNKKVISFLFNLINIDNSSKEKFIDTIHVIKNDFWLLFKLFIMSISFYSIAMIMAIVSLRALSTEVNLYAAFTLPVILLIGNIPITISGLGLREYVTITCFGILGENIAIGFSFSIFLFILITLIPGIIGYIFILTKNSDKKSGQISGLFSPLLEKWRLKKISKWIKGETILDCGCGAGKILEYVPSTITLYTGIDSDEKVIKDAKIRKTNFNRDFIVAQIGKNNLNLKNKYDNIIMSAFIEHSDIPLDTLVELKKYLKENGVIIITTPTSKAKKILNLGSKFMIFSRGAFQEHKNHFSEYELCRLINLANLRIIYYEKFELGFNQLIVARLSGD